MGKRNYIFTDKKHAEPAIMSVILGVISLAAMALVVYLTYKSDVEAPNGYGYTGLLATLFTTIGLILGIVTVRDKNNFRLFPILGIILNIISFGFISLVLYFGTW